MLVFAALAGIACPESRAQARSYGVGPSFSVPLFEAAAASGGIQFEAAFDSDTPKGYLIYREETLSVILYEQEQAPIFSGRSWTAGKSVVPDEDAAWTAIEQILAD